MTLILLIHGAPRFVRFETRARNARRGGGSASFAGGGGTGKCPMYEDHPIIGLTCQVDGPDHLRSHVAVARFAHDVSPQAYPAACSWDDRGAVMRHRVERLSA